MSRDAYEARARERFWSKVTEAPNGCWVWRAANNGGYGRFQYYDKVAVAHRWAYEQMVGEIPDGLHLDHLCRNPSCVNPSHLDPVPSIVNIRRGNAVSRTHCRNGHEYAVSGQSVAIDSQGRRSKRCLECQRRASRKCKQRRRFREALERDRLQPPVAEVAAA